METPTPGDKGGGVRIWPVSESLACKGISSPQ